MKGWQKRDCRHRHWEASVWRLSGWGTLRLWFWGRQRHPPASPWTALLWLGGVSTRASSFQSEILTVTTPWNQLMLYRLKFPSGKLREEGKMTWWFPRGSDMPTGQRESLRLNWMFYSLCRSSALMIKMGADHQAWGGGLSRSWAAKQSRTMANSPSPMCPESSWPSQGWMWQDRGMPHMEQSLGGRWW